MTKLRMRVIPLPSPKPSILASSPDCSGTPGRSRLSLCAAPASNYPSAWQVCFPVRISFRSWSADKAAGRACLRTRSGRLQTMCLAGRKSFWWSYRSCWQYEHCSGPGYYAGLQESAHGLLGHLTPSRSTCCGCTSPAAAGSASARVRQPVLQSPGVPAVLAYPP